MLLMADNHLQKSIGHINESGYEGAHWLATFVVYALQHREEAVKNWIDLSLKLMNYTKNKYVFG